MQLKGVVLYHRDGERMHTVRFDIGSLNVVPGVSETGKSALLAIVDYCLGSRHHRVSKEDELESIGWYGLLLDLDGDTLFVARKRPDFDQGVSHKVMLRTGVVGPPAPHEVGQTTNVSTAIRELSGLLGIKDNEQDASVGPAGGARLRASIRHATPYLFQPQELIASSRFLFAGQDEDKALHIRDTLPYFLGSVDQDAMDQRRLLRRLRGELRTAADRLSDLEAPGRALEVRTGQLVRDARDAGLIPATEDADDDRRLLVRAVESPAIPGRPAPDGAASALAYLSDRRDRLDEQLREARISRRTLVQHRELASSFDDETQEQRRRGVSLGLLGDDQHPDHPASCPLCGSQDGEAIVSVSELRRELSDATARARRSASAPPRLSEAIEELDVVIVSLRARLGDIEAETTAALRRARVPTEAREEREQRAFVLGRIAAFLEEHPAADPQEIAGLQENVATLEAQVAELETLLGSDATRSRTDVAVSYVSDDMTEMARSLDLRYAPGGVRLDPFDLAIFGRAPRGPVRLDRGDIGSGKSWVGYHVVTLLALHRYFIEHDRPVPRMLLLDQPTQAFYPSEKQSQADRNIDDIPDQDQQQVHRIFKLIRDTVAELGGALQVVILDHAEIPEDWFVKATGENNWRHGRALVPADWF